MRITAAEKEATRLRILEVAGDLFRREGFDAATTRDIAQAADIASGTLFNYFATKEAIVGSLAQQALDLAHRNFVRRTAGGSLAEQLFALVAAELRQLKPLRRFLAPVLEQSFTPLVASRDDVNEARVAHLEIVARLARDDGRGDLSPMALQLYWTLYTGVLAFWLHDKSPTQEDTLALLDQSLDIFVDWLTSDSNRSR